MTRLCACGCGASLDHRHPTARFASDACRARGWKARVGYGHQSPAGALDGTQDPVRTPDRQGLPPPTQAERVLRALHQAGRHGITAVDFSAPNTIDGHSPITRLAARVMELRAEGHRIEKTGWRQKCAVYRLQEEAPRLAPAPEPAPASSTLFDLSEHRARPVSAIGGGDAA